MIKTKPEECEEVWAIYSDQGNFRYQKGSKWIYEINRENDRHLRSYEISEPIETLELFRRFAEILRQK